MSVLRYSSVFTLQLIMRRHWNQSETRLQSRDCDPAMCGKRDETKENSELNACKPGVGNMCVRNTVNNKFDLEMTTTTAAAAAALHVGATCVSVTLINPKLTSSSGDQSTNLSSR